MKIIGAGMAGLLAAQMLRRARPTVIEAQSSLPNNHHAVLRFRSDAVARATGIPFTKVTVQKAIAHFQQPQSNYCSPRDANLYAQKVLGVMRSDRSIQHLAPVERYIAPPDFIAQLADGLHIQYNTPFTGPTHADLAADTPIISTIPLPVMMRVMEQPVDWSQYSSRAIWTMVVEVLDPPTTLYQTLYYPTPYVDWYRATFTCNRLQIEYAANPMLGQKEWPALWYEEHVERVLRDFGFPEDTEWKLLPAQVDGTNYAVHLQQYGKLLPVSNEAERRSSVLRLTDMFRIYSLGRFATWRQLLLDDIVHDVNVIEQFISQRDQYSRHLHGVTTS